MIQGLLFDMDGVLVDTEVIHEKARQAVYKKYALDTEKIKAVPVTGRNTVAIFNDIQAITPFPVPLEKVIDEKRDVFVAMLQEPIQPLAGVRAMLERYAGKLPIGLVTASAGQNVDAVMANTGLGSFFNARVVAEDVTHYKPNPEAYILGAERIGVSPDNCLVFEDSPIGITAAKNAGATVVALRTGNDLEGLDHADCVADTIEAGWEEIIPLIEKDD
jgi:HAD superfamily hydrolase (TIGR01509 family)